jgi:hypothetical protein
MPTYFHFHFHNPAEPQDDINFNGQLVSQRCNFIKTHGSQCKRRCVIGLPCCHSHLPIKYHIQVKPSHIPGANKGLFAYDKTKGANDIVFKGRRDTHYTSVPGQKICPYFGEVLTNAELDQRYGNLTAPYGIQVAQDRYEDAALKRGVGSLINHKPSNQANCEFFKTNNLIELRAKKNIRNGQELYVNYGNDYSLHDDHVTSSTNHSKYHI